MAKTNPGRFFEDYSVGDVIRHGGAQGGVAGVEVGAQLGDRAGAQPGGVVGVGRVGDPLGVGRCDALEPIAAERDHVGEVLPDERNRVTLSDERDEYDLPVPRITFSLRANEKAMIAHALDFMEDSLGAVGARSIWRETDDSCHLNGTARMGDDPSTSVVDADCRSWDIPNLWVCDGSVFPTVGGANPSLTIQAIACRTADRIGALARQGAL